MSRKTLERSKPVLINAFEEKFLKRNIEMLGYQVIELEHGTPFELPGGGQMEIYAADNCDPELCAKFVGCAPVESKFKITQIDSLCVISDGDHVILNTNDCPFDLARTVVDRVLAKHGQIDLLLVGYAGAGPFPQCFTFSDYEAKRAAADRKRDQFIGQAVKYIRAVNPRAYMPFAGTYVLGGRLAPLNDSRGVPSLSDALARIETQLQEKGRGFLLNAGVEYDVSRGETAAAYDEPSAEEQGAYLAGTLANPYDFDGDEKPTADALMAAMQAAFPRFQGKTRDIGFTADTQIVIRDGDELCATFGVATAPEAIAPDTVEDMDNFVEITVDGRLLARLLQGPRFAHWNNAEIGSHLKYRRVPDVFERGLYYCLSAFHA